MSLIILPLFKVAIILHALFFDTHRTFQFPCKTNHGALGQADSSLDLMISLKVPKSTISEDPFVFSIIFSLPYEHEMLARSTPAALISSPLKMYLGYMRLYIVQQFIIFTENVERVNLFLSETFLHKLLNTNVVISYKII